MFPSSENKNNIFLADFVQAPRFSSHQVSKNNLKFAISTNLCPVLAKRTQTKIEKQNRSFIAIIAAAFAVIFSTLVFNFDLFFFAYCPSGWVTKFTFDDEFWP